MKYGVLHLKIFSNVVVMQETYSEPYETSNMESFLEIVNG